MIAVVEPCALAALKALSIAARSALDAAPSGSLDVGFELFPKGACGPVAELIGRIVLERLGCEGVYVYGDQHPRLRPEQSHAWLEVQGFIVDLTHDQFSGTGTTGYVLRSSAWHTQFHRAEQPLCLHPSMWGQYPHRAYAVMKTACDGVHLGC